MKRRGWRMPRSPNETWLTPDWPAPGNVHARVTTRQLPGNSKAPFDKCNLGDRCGDDPETVASNRAALISLLGLPANPHWLKQVHGTQVSVADQESPELVPEADAAVTRATEIVLAVLTADCLPVFFCTDDGDGIALAHAGWRGLAAGVLESSLAELGGNPSRVLAWLGPSIGAASYEVGEEVRQAFLDQDRGAAAAFSETRPGHWRCDLPALARMRLAAAGVIRISGGSFDTFSDARFYSYRRDPHCGRFASLIWRSGH
jgi:polyphenol oxidase